MLGRALLFLAGIAIAALVFRAILLCAALAWPALTHPAWWIAPTLLIAALLYRRSSRWTGGRTFREQVRRDLRRGELAIRRLEVTDAIEFEEVEDCGPCFVMLTSGGETLLFDGQYLESFKRRGFPWSSFEIHEAPESGVFFGLHGAGERLKPSTRLPAMSFGERKALGSFNKSYQVIDVNFAALKARANARR